MAEDSVVVDWLTVDTDTLLTVDTELHAVKRRFAKPAGNSVFRLLFDLTKPVCDELERRGAP